jgi:predicted CoA-binding protein
MVSQTAIDSFLDARHLAVVGVSRQPKAFANTVYRTLRDGGRTLYPVNERAGGRPIEGDPSYRSLTDVPDPVDGVLVMVPPDAMTTVVDEALDRSIPRVWLFRSGGPPVPADAVARCRAAGVEVVDGACPLMFEDPVRGIHRFHRVFFRRHLAA